MITATPDPPKNNISYTKKVWIAGAIALFLVIIFLLFKSLFSLFLLTLAGVLLAVYIHGFAHLIRFIPLSKSWRLVIAILINLLLLAAFLWFAGARLQQQLSSLADTLPTTIETAKTKLRENPLGSKALDYFQSSGNSEKTSALIKKFFSSSFGILSDLYIILLLAAFFIASPNTYKKGIVHLLPARAKEKGEHLLEELGHVLKNWLKGQIFGFAFIAVLTGLGLWAIGMPLIFTLALIAGLLNFIPNFGPIIALIPAVLLALMQGSDMVILVICLYTFTQVIQSAVTQPLIQKRMVNIPPALIIFGQVAMGVLGGFWGVLLATPTVAIIMTLVKKLYTEKTNENTLVEVKE